MEKNIYNKLLEIKKAGVKLKRDTKAFNYKYATLDQIQEKLNPLLEKQKLVVTHFIQDNAVTTQIVDLETGEKVGSIIPLAEGTKPQDKGSEITYYRRYNLVALFDLEVEDDDAQAAQNSYAKKETKWLGYKDLEAIAAAGNVTEAEVARVIKEDGFTLSNAAKNAVREYVETGVIDKGLFFNK